MNVFSRITSKLKKVAVRSIAVLALVATCVVPATTNSTFATGNSTPRFNFLQGDVEMLKAANQTKNQPDWADPVTGSYAANVGDEIVFRFYFHNGMIDSTAHNVTLRASVPTVDSTQSRVNSYLDSDETSVITDTVIDGQILGYGQGYSQIDLANSGHLEYINGSTKMWRHSPEQWGTVIADGITSANGLNIGNIQGCWDYAGYVTFKTRVVAAPNPAQLVVNKYVSTANSNNWVETLNGAHENDTVSYKISVADNGQLPANNVLVKDSLPAHVSYVAGTTKLYSPSYPSGQTQADTITTSGINVQSIAASMANQIYFTFNARIGTGLAYPGGIATLVNTARVTYNSQELTDQATVNVVGNNGMSIEKKVWNGNCWVEQNNIHLGDHIRYQITVSNTGQTTLTNINVSDVIPVYTEYINGSTTLNGNAYSDGITSSNGLTFASLASGANMTIVFEVRTYGCPPVGDYTLVNSARAYATAVSSISDTASTIMTLVPVSGPNINQL